MKTTTTAPVIKTNAPVIKTNAPTTKKPRTRTTTRTTEEPTVHPEEVKLQNSIDNCIDIYETNKCQALMNSGMSCEKDHLEMFCERSCGFCGKIFNDLCLISFVMCGLRTASKAQQYRSNQYDIFHLSFCNLCKEIFFIF